MRMSMISKIFDRLMGEVNDADGFVKLIDLADRFGLIESDPKEYPDLLSDRTIEVDTGNSEK